MGRVKVLLAVSLLGTAFLAGGTHARATDIQRADGASPPLSDGFTGYAAAAAIGIGGEVRFERGAARPPVAAALAQPIAVARTEWHT